MSQNHQAAAEQARSLFDAHQKLGERIAFLRRQKGLTQEKIAKTIGVHTMLIAKWEGKDGRPFNMKLRNAANLAKALGVPLSTLLRGIDL